MRRRFGPTALACGTGGDAARHLLWRVRHGLTSGAVPLACAITIGTNDLAWHETPDRLWPAVAETLGHLHAAWPDALLLLTSVPPAAWPGMERPMARIRAANDRLRSIAARQGAGWVDLTPALTGPDGLLGARMANDGVHLTRRAYRLWAAALAQAITPPPLGTAEATRGELSALRSGRSATGAVSG